MSKLLLKAIIPFVAFSILVVLLVMYSEHQAWEKIGSSVSTTGDFTVFHYHYKSDIDRHAPYGNYLFLARSNDFGSPLDGYLIFAGYCKDISVKWVDEKHIHISSTNCPGRDVRTLSDKAFGIEIQVVGPSL